ncbi:unnamed protein product [Durusdinium trenchii]|uniref:Lcl C-terminal domain-containing protein n=1 Tax=Durusdinium trenchii TaxID=1381693 RepID=A0ABP0IFQ3_9DINO
MSGRHTLAAYSVVDTAQSKCFGVQDAMTCPASGAFFGQDAQYNGLQPSYTDNIDGTVTDANTGLMWQKDPGSKMQYADAVAAAGSFTLAGHSDWRVPSIKELYSLILFSGRDVSGVQSTDASALTPFIDSSFGFQYGNVTAGERVIDSQWVTSNVYVSTVMNQQECFFGVNFADGRIKCYPTSSNADPASPSGNSPGGGCTEGSGPCAAGACPDGPPPDGLCPDGSKPPPPSRRLASLGYFAIYVRGPAYGENQFAKIENANNSSSSVISDAATNLTWMLEDSGQGLSWQEALAYCESSSHAGLTDWRLPNAHELHTIVDYSRSPDTTSSAAIDPLFAVSSLTNEAGQTDYPFYWTSTTHATEGPVEGGYAVYIGFGRCLGKMNDQWIDVHGAGCQRSDPKTGDATSYPDGHGPQGDAVRIQNHVRCVRTGTLSSSTDPISMSRAGEARFWGFLAALLPLSGF